MSRTSTTEFENRSESRQLDQFYRALASQRRRIAIRVLNERVSLDVDALAGAIADREPGESDHESIEITLVHQHLPLLADADIVDYDGEEKHVTMRRAADAVLPLDGPLPQ